MGNFMLVEFKDETIILNWDEIQEDKMRFDIQLRDAIFQELQKNFPDNVINSTILFKMNEYVINRLKEKKDVLHNRSSNKTS